MAIDELTAILNRENIKFRAALEEIANLWEASTYQGSDVTVRMASETAAKALGRELRPNRA